VLLDVSELEVRKIHLIVKDLRSYASMLLELVSLVNLKLRLGNARHPRPLPRHGGGARGDPRGPHPDEASTGTRGNAVRTLENVLKDLDACGTVDGALKGRLEDVRETLWKVLSQAGG